MAYNSIYTRINWKNETESRSTPLGATNLNKMDYVLSEIDKRVVELSKQDESFATKEEIPEISVATSETVGVVKPDGVTTKIDEDGTIHAVGGGGGGGTGTTDYEDLYNKPSINDVELSGNVTLEEIGAQAKGSYAELDENGNLNVPERVKANTAEFSDGIYSSGGIYEDNQYGGNAVVKTEDELSSLTAEGYMPDALLVKALHQSMGGYSFYNNPYVVYEKSSSEPFLLDGECILSDSDTGAIYITDTENYYSAIVSGDYKRREGADTVSPFSGLGNIECVAELFSGDKYTTSKNCLIFVHGANTTESGLPTTIKPVVSSGILNELAKTTTKKWDGHYHAIAVYYLSLNGESSIISLASGSTPKALIFV